MGDALLQNFRKHIDLSDEEFNSCRNLFTSRHFKKRQFILQEGEICRYEYFILKGCARIYRVDNRGKEQVLQFGIENWWIGDLNSFFTKTVSSMFIDCIEDCDVLQLSQENLEFMYRQVPKMERFFRIIIQNAFIAMQKRLLNNIGNSASEQYRGFVNSYPDIGRRIPDHQIASYLGITPQSLSRIRKKFSEKLP